MAKITILGAGGWGLGLAITALRSGNDVTVWSPFENEVDMLNLTRKNEKLLPGVAVPDKIKITGDISSVAVSDITVIATPSLAVRETAKRIAALNNYGIIVSVAKGIEYETLMRLSEVIKSEIPDADVVVLSGPSHAEEVARGIETSLVASSESKAAAQFVQNAFANDKLRVYTNDDVVGVELGGALKNVIAIASGFCDGMHLGDNTRAALITRGLTEMARLGVAMGADEKTFAGLTGMGDLIVTCTSIHSRNHRFGRIVGEGKSVEDALALVGTVEGYYAAKTTHKIIKQYDVEMPILEACYEVMYKGLPAGDAVKRLMTRPNRAENETCWLSK